MDSEHNPELIIPLPTHPRIPSPIQSDDSSQSQILRLSVRPGSRLSLNSNASSSSLDRQTKSLTDQTSHIRVPFKFDVNEDRVLRNIPTPIPRYVTRHLQNTTKAVDKKG
jgi:hypothetical protein